MLSLDMVSSLVHQGRLRELARRHKEVSDAKLSKCLREVEALFVQGEFEINRYLRTKARKKGTCHGDCCGGGWN